MTISAIMQEPYKYNGVRTSLALNGFLSMSIKSIAKHVLSKIEKKTKKNPKKFSDTSKIHSARYWS